MSSGHTHNRNGRGNQRRKHGPPRQQPQNSQSQNGQPQNGQPHGGQQQQPHGEQNTSARPTPAMSMTAPPARPDAPFQAPDDLSPGGNGAFMIVESVTAEIREVTLEVEIEPPPTPEPTPPVLPRPTQQRNTHPPGKRGPFLVSSERQNGADGSSKSNGHSNQHGMQNSSIPRGNGGAPHMQPAPSEPFVVESPAPSGPPRSRRGEHDMPHPNANVMQRGETGDTDDGDTDYVAHERRPLRDVRGDVGSLIDELHDLFTQDRGIASQGNTSRCGICYLHYPISGLEYREVEGYYVCVDCKRALGPTRLMMLRRQQKN